MLDTLPCAVVFDFDGTLAELVIDFDEMKRRVAAVAAEFLVPPPDPGPTPVLEWIDSLRKEIDGRCGHDAGVHFYFQAQAAVMGLEIESAASGRLFAGTRHLLETLRHAGVKLGVITRNCEAAVERVFPEIESHCDIFLPRDRVRRVKPDPRHLLQAVAFLACEPEEALMVGDHPMDITTAMHAKTLSAGVTSGRSSSEELLAAGAMVVAPNAVSLFSRVLPIS